MFKSPWCIVFWGSSLSQVLTPSAACNPGGSVPRVLFGQDEVTYQHSRSFVLADRSAFDVVVIGSGWTG